MNIARTAFDILLILALFVAPFTILCVLALIGLMVFPRYAEFVLLALFVQLIYPGGDMHLLGASLSLTIFALLVFIVAEFLKVFIRTRMI